MISHTLAGTMVPPTHLVCLGSKDSSKQYCSSREHALLLAGSPITVGPPGCSGHYSIFNALLGLGKKAYCRMLASLLGGSVAPCVVNDYHAAARTMRMGPMGLWMSAKQIETLILSRHLQLGDNRQHALTCSGTVLITLRAQGAEHCLWWRAVPAEGRVALLLLLLLMEQRR
jgi:hypothetical protein